VADTHVLAETDPSPATADARARRRLHIDRDAVLRFLPAFVGVLVPTLLFGHYAWNHSLAFDGGLNYQVVESLAHGHGYIRPYDGSQAFPQEIETSGPFLFLGAFFVWLFGDGPSVMQLANILFLGVLAGAIAYFVRGHRVAQLLGPSVVLFLVPGISTFGFHGYGEVPTVALALVAMLLLGSAFGERSRALAVHAAFAVAGIVFTIKVIGGVCFAVLLPGFVLLLLVRPTARRVSVFLAPLSFAIAPVLFELYRLVSLGSWKAYTDFWSKQGNAISSQAAKKANGTLWQKGLDHVHLLSKQTGVSSGWLVLWMALPFALVVATFVLRSERWTRWFCRTDVATTLMVAMYAGLYDFWWVFLTPTEKAWLRRFLIGFILTNVVLLRVGVEIVQRVRETRAESSAPALRRFGVPALAVALAAVLVAAVPALEAPTRGQARTVCQASDAGLHTTLAASNELRRIAGQGYYPAGIAWWASPVVSVQADVTLIDLKKITPCSPEWAPRIASGRVIVVWDQNAYFLAAKSPVGVPGLSYTLFSQPNQYASFWTVSFKKPCPTS